MKEGNAKDLLLEDALQAAIEAEREILLHKRINWILILTIMVMVIVQLVVR